MNYNKPPTAVKQVRFSNVHVLIFILNFLLIRKPRLLDESADFFDMVENKLFLSLAHQKTAEILEKTFICTRCVEGFKESQGLFESVMYRYFIISEIFFNRNSGSYLVESRKRLILQR